MTVSGSSSKNNSILSTRPSSVSSIDKSNRSYHASLKAGIPLRILSHAHTNPPTTSTSLVINCSSGHHPVEAIVGVNGAVEMPFKEAVDEGEGPSTMPGVVAPSSQASPQILNHRYKTELCRPFEETGNCKYGDKCQFAHGYDQLKALPRHPRYKTEMCRTFHTQGFCPYGTRCHFIHNEDLVRPSSDPLSICSSSGGGGSADSGKGSIGAFPEDSPSPPTSEWDSSASFSPTGSGGAAFDGYDHAIPSPYEQQLPFSGAPAAGYLTGPMTYGNSCYGGAPIYCLPSAELYHQTQVPSYYCSQTQSYFQQCQQPDTPNMATSDEVFWNSPVHVVQGTHPNQWSEIYYPVGYTDPNLSPGPWPYALPSSENPMSPPSTEYPPISDPDPEVSEIISMVSTLQATEDTPSKVGPLPTLSQEPRRLPIFARLSGSSNEAMT